MNTHEVTGAAVFCMLFLSSSCKSLKGNRDSGMLTETVLSELKQKKSIACLRRNLEIKGIRLVRLEGQAAPSGFWLKGTGEISGYSAIINIPESSSIYLELNEKEGMIWNYALPIPNDKKGRWRVKNGILDPRDSLWYPDPNWGRDYKFIHETPEAEIRQG